MNIHIEHLTINIIQPQELVQEKPAAPVGYRTQEEKLKIESARLEHLRLQLHAAKLQHKLRIAERLRTLFGDEVANSVMAGTA
jgi:division protein CdvB (Snf7/Vps24/ESCRT-III family)